MRKMTLASILMSSFLLLSACDTQNDNEPMDEPDDTTEQTEDNQQEETDQDETNENETETKGIENHEFDLSLEDAVDKFYDEYGEMDIYAVELTTEDNIYQYEIKGYQDNTEYKVHIHADNGEILSDKEEDDHDEHLMIHFEKLLSPKDAMDIALSELPDGAYVTSWELEEEDGKMAYEIEYDFEDDDMDDDDITIEAYNGDILDK